MGMRCVLRQTVIDQLLYEIGHAATLPECMRHHAAARYHLRSNRVVSTGHDKNRTDQRRAVSHATTICREYVLDVPAAQAQISSIPCNLRSALLQALADSPQIVRNWRVLWRSCSAAVRRERLLSFFSSELAKHRASNVQGQWHANYTFLG